MPMYPLFFRLLEPDLHLIRNPELREAAGLLP